MPDFNLGAVLQDPTMQKNLADALSGVNQHITESVKAKEQADAAKKTKFTWDSSTNTVQGTMDADYMKQIASDLQAYQGVRAEYDKMLAQNAQQMATQRAHPFANTLAQIAASLASTDTNPVTRGIGQAATRLNPTMAEMQKERMGLLQGQEGAIKGATQAAATMGSLGLEQTREARLANESNIRQKTEFQRENVGAVIRGEGDPVATTKLAVESGYIKPEQAETYQKYLEGMKASYNEKKTAEEKQKFENAIKLEMAKATVAAQNQARVFAQQDKITAARIAATAAETDKKLAAAEKKGETKKAELKDFEVKELEQYVAADKALSEVEAILKTKEAQQIMGPYSGTAARLGAKYAPKFADPNGVIQGMDSKLKLQTAQAIKSTGAGARGFGPMERPFFEGLAEGLTHSPEQNQKIIDTWREYLDQARRGVLANHSDETLAKYPKMFGPRLSGGGAESGAKKLVFNPKTGKIEEQ